jgi:carbamoyltransferase
MQAKESTPMKKANVLDRLYDLIPNSSETDGFIGLNALPTNSNWQVSSNEYALFSKPSTGNPASVVLGISCFYHDSAASLIQNGVVVAAAEEERFSRRKHDNSFPSNAIAYCLRQARLNIADVDMVAFYEQPLRKLERLLLCGKHYREHSGEYIKTQLALALHNRLDIENVVRNKLAYHGPVVCVPHHLSHAASTFYTSPFENSAIMTVDGVGEWATTAQYVGTGNKIRSIREIRYPDSLGMLYSAITSHLGFKVNNDEYKVMGLAAFGKPIYREKIQQLICTFPDGSFRLTREYFAFMYDGKRMNTPALTDLLGPQRLEGEPITDYHQNVAASVQVVLEEVLLAMAHSLYELANRPANLCLAGGVALNSVANWRLFSETPFEAVWVQPAAGDSGGAIGAALAASVVLNETRQIRPYSTLLGEKFSNTDIEIVLKQESVVYRWFLEEELLPLTADLILSNRIVAWFQGRMEFGPRALGSRSILANASNPDMQDVLNRRVKFREDFRPFAPSVLAECANEYFDLPFESPYMLFVCPVREKYRSHLPAVTHVDGTARVQTVSTNDNPRFYRLLQEVQRQSGIPVIINTSFNIRGEPIVCTPQDAVRCFLKTDIDFLIIGDFLVTKLA